MIKKMLATGLSAAVLLSFAGVARAQTSVDQLQALLQQVKVLQDQLAELQKKQGSTMTELKETIALARDLREGMTSDEVTALQELLAADPDVYPEGVISGYFGPLTAKAVRKFQAKHGIETVGTVGPKTRAKLNELAGNKDFACRAWGKLIAPGQLKKRVGNTDIDLSACAKVPEGIVKKLTGTTTATTTDTTAPVISNIDESDIEGSMADISWTTNERAKGTVWYSEDEDIEDELDDAESETASTFALEHTVDLTGLDTDTTYYYFIVVSDKAGNTATSSVKNFTTDDN